MAAERASRMAEGLIRAGVDPITAYGDAKARHLYLDGEDTAPRLPVDLAPFGRPELRAGWREDG